MPTCVALLRAVNVSGKNRVPMAELRSLLEELGLRRVRTHLQSGNVVFDADLGAATGTSSGVTTGTAGDIEHASMALARRLAADIEMRIERDLGPRVGVLVLPADVLAAVAGANPFSGAPGVDEKSLHVTFLLGAAAESGCGSDSDAASGAACAAAFDGLKLPLEGGEQALIAGPPALSVPVIYLCLPLGYGRTKLTNSYFERKLGVTATTRNWRTMLALAALSSAL